MSITRDLVPGQAITVSVPATSANVGPGFDCFGLALDWREQVDLEVIESGYAVDVTGEGAEAIPRDESHLVLSATLTGLADLGVRTPGLRLRAHNTLPHGRGLGSSSAAIVAGWTRSRTSSMSSATANDAPWLRTIIGTPSAAALTPNGTVGVVDERLFKVLLLLGVEVVVVLGHDGQRLGQGRENAKQFLRDNPEVAGKIEALIRQNAGLLADRILDQATPTADDLDEGAAE